MVRRIISAKNKTDLSGEIFFFYCFSARTVIHCNAL